MYTNEIEFIDTEKVMKNLNNISYCSVAEMTKCLNLEACKLWRHNRILRFVSDHCASKHFHNKMEAMMQDPSTKSQANAAAYDWYNIMERPLFKHQLSRNFPSKGNVYGINMMLIFGSIFAFWVM
uniref:Uncharacterized protein n=1 Tax=Panagrolaimus sp. ES5 TaxID=591445 RepID=A0AC34FUX9_9BILA